MISRMQTGGKLTRSTTYDDWERWRVKREIELPGGTLISDQPVSDEDAAMMRERFLAVLATGVRLGGLDLLDGWTWVPSK